MKKVYILFYVLFLFLNAAFSQTATWTWISGSKTPNAAAVGVQGQSSVNNHPAAMYEPCEWKDKQGNFWIYGGWRQSPVLHYSDLWKFNPVNLTWTWVNGNGQVNQSPFGLKGIPNSGYSPGSRINATATWVDTSGALWLFGGDYWRSDLWKYDIANNQWTWVAGDTTVNTSGVYGSMGVPGTSNYPGARNETCSAWTDSLNNLWLFGGNGYDAFGNKGSLNDLWRYDILNNEWTWMKGSDVIGAVSSYGTKGSASVNNDPGCRLTYTKWKDAKGNFWLIGGYRPGAPNTYYNDVWEFDLGLNQWIWMSGTNTANNPGQYLNPCTYNANLPYSRAEHRSAVTDNKNRFWLFGGVYNSTSLFNDLWVFDSQQLKWNWISGTNVPNQSGSYGTLDSASTNNMPPSREGAVAWWGNDNRFYMFGGVYANTPNYFSDVWVFNPDSNCVNGVSVLPPVAAFQASKTTICANDCISFSDHSTNNPTSWKWSFPGGNPSSSTLQNPPLVCYLTAGNYDVTLVATNAGGSDTLTYTNFINVNAAPTTPSINQSHDTLYCSYDPAYTSYQWYADSTLVPGATKSFYVAPQSGNYNVVVRNENGCSISVGINVVLGLQDYSYHPFISLYPNPVKDELTVISYLLTDRSRMIILNVLGEIIDTRELNSRQEILYCKSFSSGIYFVLVQNEKQKWVGRFVKE